MAIERIYYCDGPANPGAPNETDADRCGAHVRTASPPPYLPASFLRVQQGGPGVDVDATALHFCSWDCLLRFSASKPPLEVVPWSDGGSA